MKKFKIGAMALALTLGVAGAFATTSAKAGKFVDPNWQTVDASGNTVDSSLGGIYDPNRTALQAQGDYGCDGSGDLCAGTVSAKNQPTTPSSQFIQHQ